MFFIYVGNGKCGLSRLQVVNRMFALATPFSGLTCGLQHPIHRVHRAVITAFIEQGRVNCGRSGVDEPVAVEDIQDVLPFGLTQRERAGRAGFARCRTGRAIRPVLARWQPLTAPARCQRADFLSPEWLG
jgi:hypothetical protein